MQGMAPLSEFYLDISTVTVDRLQMASLVYCTVLDQSLEDLNWRYLLIGCYRAEECEAILVAEYFQILVFTLFQSVTGQWPVFDTDTAGRSYVMGSLGGISFWLFSRQVARQNVLRSSSALCLLPFSYIFGVAGGWWLMAGGWWLATGGWWVVHYGDLRFFFWRTRYPVEWLRGLTVLILYCSRLLSRLYLPVVLIPEQYSTVNNVPVFLCCTLHSNSK